jgi:hypothetical protein
MFFLRRTRPLELTAKRMRALRLSLNTPVVAMQDLPAGAARAAITLHAEPRGGLAVTVSVRSLGCGSVVHYGFEGTIASSAVNEVLDAALSFAEGMGFLFDDELVGTDTAAQEKALVRFSEAIGSAEGAPTRPEEPEPAVELFDRAAEDLTDPPVETPQLAVEAGGREAFAFVEPEPDEEAGPGELRFRTAEESPPGVPLTKFRVRADTAHTPEGRGADAAPGLPAKRMLGRVRLERRRSNKLVQDARRSWLLRLVTCF